MDRDQLIDQLCAALMNNIYLYGENITPLPPIGVTRLSTLDNGTPAENSCMWQVYRSNTRVCTQCRTPNVHWFCTCGMCVCPASSTRVEMKDCFVRHLREVATQTLGRSVVRVIARETGYSRQS